MRRIVTIMQFAIIMARVLERRGIDRNAPVRSFSRRTSPQEDNLATCHSVYALQIGARLELHKEQFQSPELVFEVQPQAVRSA